MSGLAPIRSPNKSQAVTSAPDGSWNAQPARGSGFSTRTERTKRPTDWERSPKVLGTARQVIRQ